MNCEQVRERLVDLHEGLVAADDAPELRGHVAGCAACRGALEEIAGLHGRLERLAGGGGGEGAGPVDGAMVAELTMVRIGSRKPGELRGARLRGSLRWVVPLAAAACVGAAVTINLIAPQRAAAATLAQVAERVQKAGSVAYTVKVASMDEAEEEPPITLRIIISNGKRLRAEVTHLPGFGGAGWITVSDLESGSTLFLTPDARRAERMTKAPNRSAVETYRALIGLGEQNGVVIGEETINGEATRVVRVDPASAAGGAAPESKEGFSEAEMRVWVGVVSGRPVRVEQTAAGRMPDGRLLQLKISYSDFAFDAAHDPALFSLDPPAGYEMEGERMEPAAALGLATERMRLLAGELRDMRRRRGFWPSLLLHLAGKEEFQTDLFRNPRRPEKDADGFLYFRPVDGMLGDEGVLFEPPCAGGTPGCVDGWAGSALVGYIDGRVEEVKDRVRYEAMLQRARERVKNDNPGHNEMLRRLNEGADRRP